MEKQVRKKQIHFKSYYMIVAAFLVAIGLISYKIADNAIPQTENENFSEPAEDEKDNFEFIVPETKPEEVNEDAKEEEEINTSPADTPVIAEYFVLPINGGEIIKEYSETELVYSKTYNDYRLHTGLDIKPNGNLTVNSCGDGKVTGIDGNTAYGTVVSVDHGGGVIIRYCGVENVSVKVGDTLTAGQKIGTVGTVNCECNDESHIHLECLKDGKPASPVEILNINE